MNQKDKPAAGGSSGRPAAWNPGENAGEIYVVGLGPGDPMQLPALNLSLMRGRPVYLRTGRHPLVPYLQREGVRLQTLDEFYERYASFDEVYRQMAGFLLDAAAPRHTRAPGARAQRAPGGRAPGAGRAKAGGEPGPQPALPVVFAVPGNPLVGETVVDLLLAGAAARGVRVRLWPAPGFLDAVLGSLGLDPAQGLFVTESFQLLRQDETHRGPGRAPRRGRVTAGYPAGGPSGSQAFCVPPGAGLLIAQVYSQALASEVKLTLMEQFPDEHPLTVIQAAGIPGQERRRLIPLYELDRLDSLDHLTSVYVPPLRPGLEAERAPGRRPRPAPPPPITTGKRTLHLAAIPSTRCCWLWIGCWLQAVARGTGSKPTSA